VTWLPAPPGAADSPPRLALATGRTVGNAVVRNRLRRRLRALVTEAASEGRVGPGAYLVAVAPAAAPLSYGELRTHLMSALAAATRA
jgi:ribonuclease P protein component